MAPNLGLLDRRSVVTAPHAKGNYGGVSHPSERFEMAYAVHTATCTYLLDDDGICRWIVSQRGVVPAHVQQCIGAQFVACLDMEVVGGLLGTLATGARGLFVKNTGTHMILLRTGIIEHVDDRRAPGAPIPSRPPPAAAVTERSAHQYGKRAGVPTLPAPQFGVVEYSGEEATVTVSLTRTDRR